MTKSLVEMAAEIVAAQASHTRMSPEEMAEGLKKIYDALESIEISERKNTSPENTEKVEQSMVVSQPPMVPKASIQRSKIICLECGKSFKQISNRHLIVHGLDAKTYRKKYGFPARQSLSARELTARRRKSAQERQLGEKLKEARAKRKKTSA